MINTFNCGVGFCIIVDKKKISKIKQIFTKNFKPYEIGFISKEKTKVNLINSIKWKKKKLVFLYQDKDQI